VLSNSSINILLSSIAVDGIKSYRMTSVHLPIPNWPIK